MPARERAQPRTLSAHDQHARSGQVHGRSALRALSIGPDDPEPGILEQPQGARQIGHDRHRRGFRSTGRDLTRRRIERCGTIARNNQRQYATGVRSAQTRAEVVRILHAVERKQQRIARAGERGEQFLFTPRGQRQYFGGNALMRHISEPGAQAASIDALDRASGGVRELLDLRGPGVRAAMLQ